MTYRNARATNTKALIKGAPLGKRARALLDRVREEGTVRVTFNTDTRRGMAERAAARKLRTKGFVRITPERVDEHTTVWTVELAH